MRVAIAGFGWWGRHIASQLADSPEIDVALIADSDISLHGEISRRGLEAASSFEEVLDHPGIDAVILTTPHMVHEEQVVAAAAAGKHVFCEKPLGLTAASARRSVDACRKAGVVLGIGHERRFEPAMKRLQAMIAAGEIGTVLHAEAAFSHDKLAGAEPGGWRTSKAHSPGAGMTGTGIHLTDLFIWMFGRVAAVQAQTRDRVLGWQTGDMVTAQFGFHAGMTASLSAILATPYFARFHVFGSRKWVEVRNATHPDTPGGLTSFTVAESGREPVTDQITWSDAVVENLETFAAAVRGDARYPWTDEELIHNIAVYEAIVASADSGQTVVLA